MPGPESGAARHPGEFVVAKSVTGSQDFVQSDGTEEVVSAVLLASMPPKGGYKIINLWIDPNGTTLRWARVESPET